MANKSWVEPFSFCLNIKNIDAANPGHFDLSDFCKIHNNRVSPLIFTG